MSVEFQEEEMPIAAHAKLKKHSLITRTLIGLHIAKDEVSAQRILLIIAGLCLAAAVLIFLNLLGIL